MWTVLPHTAYVTIHPITNPAMNSIIPVPQCMLLNDAEEWTEESNWSGYCRCGRCVQIHHQSFEGKFHGDGSVADHIFQLTERDMVHVFYSGQLPAAFVLDDEIAEHYFQEEDVDVGLPPDHIRECFQSQRN